VSETLGAASALASTTGGLVSDITRNLLIGGGAASNGNRSYYRGVPLMLRTSRYATVHNKANRSIQAMPRQKFLFYATFNPGPNLTNVREFSSWQSGFAFQIKEVDRPKATPKLVELNQYNRKRLIHTGVEYGDITVSLHDTVDDRVLRVWRDYHKWYFGEGRGKNAATTWKSSVISAEMPTSNGWGFSPPNTMQWDTNFFDSLDIYTFYGRKYTQVRIYNPKISSLTFDGMSTSSSEFSAVELTVKHEGFEYVDVAQPLTEKQITLFNLNGGDYFEPSDAFGGVNSFLMDLNDSIESSIDSLLGSVSSIPFVGGVLAGLGSNAVRASGVTGIPARLARGLASSSLSRWGRFS
jgi:hypothetical protein